MWSLSSGRYPLLGRGLDVSLGQVSRLDPGDLSGAEDGGPGSLDFGHQHGQVCLCLPRGLSAQVSDEGSWPGAVTGPLPVAGPSCLLNIIWLHQYHLRVILG